MKFALSSFFGSLLLFIGSVSAQIPASPSDESRDSDPQIEDTMKIVDTAVNSALIQKGLPYGVVLFLLGMSVGVLVERQAKKKRR